MSRTLWISLGTTAELVKVYPLLHLASEEGIPWFVLSTGQSGPRLLEQWNDFGLPLERHAALYPGKKDLDSLSSGARWTARAAVGGLRVTRERIARLTGTHPGPNDRWLVHGDTISTLLGALIARRTRTPLAHVEAGLRTGRLLEPFPEEITRRALSRLADIHFAQDPAAARALTDEKARGRVVLTSGNTLADAVTLTLRNQARGLSLRKGFALVSIHRTETLGVPARWRTAIDVTIQAARQRHVVFITHPATRRKLDEGKGDLDRLRAAGVEIIPRQLYSRFLMLLENCDFVISDSGSNQEECSYLGKPCLLLRSSTERSEGLDGCCVLSHFDAARIGRFLEAPEAYRRQPCLPALSPSRLILDALKGRFGGFAEKPRDAIFGTGTDGPF